MTEAEKKKIRDALVMKRAMETLDTVNAGLSEGALFDFVERQVGSHLTVGDRAELKKKLLEKEWIMDYTDKLTDETKYCITQAGRLAMVAL